MIRLEEKSPDCYLVYWQNGTYLGDFVKDVDGYFKYFPENTGGYWSDHMLMCLWGRLTELNRAWEETVQTDPAIGGTPWVIK